MKISERGLKHICQECKIMFYDLKKEIVICPKCGTEPSKAKLLKSTRVAGKPARPVNWNGRKKISA